MTGELGRLSGKLNDFETGAGVQFLLLSFPLDFKQMSIF
jgi:hypothetical protein